jgi:hypothetical protein
MVTKSTFDAQSHCGRTFLAASATAAAKRSDPPLGTTGSGFGALATATSVDQSLRGSVFEALRISSHFSESLGGWICLTASWRANVLLAPFAT